MLCPTLTTTIGGLWALRSKFPHRRNNVGDGGYVNIEQWHRRTVQQEEPRVGEVWRGKGNGTLVMVSRIDIAVDIGQPIRCWVKADGLIWAFDGPIERFYRGYERTDLKSLD